jgi:phosphate uptake regulator
METRNIQKTGGSSYTITLPKSWVVANKLDQNDSVEIYPRNHAQLLIQTQASGHPYAVGLPINYLNDAQTVRELIGIYISGADEIRITANSITYEQRSLIRSLSNKLIGFELFEESSKMMTLKNVASPLISSPEYIKKMLTIIRSMYDDIILTLLSSDRKLARDIIERDVEVDRIHLAIQRQFNKFLSSLVPEKVNDFPANELYFYALAALRLERIADHIVRIAYMISVLDPKQSVSLNKFEMADVKKITAFLEVLTKILINLDKSAAHKTLEAYDEVVKNKFINRTINDKPSINILIQDSIERIRSYVSNIAEETINFTNIKPLP